ncbi:MAG: tRNA (cytidine(34)-2'-O)-methyltransferase [Actinomycetaceae bacterium]|nr:tRNA (cytidine(34)-2'-O)-methyltransferase [Actinomycetaceae bacterium]MDY6083227.1 tRNA (cytidine(34)-2'-O)-methyltransferase [Actinomycetaceae bacterium]
MFHLVYYTPEIPGNTGAAIRLCACTGAILHLIEPLGFDFSDTHLKRAGLDYHDLADVQIHHTFDDFLATLTAEQRIFAFTGHTTHNFADVHYRDSDVLLFGPEQEGLPVSIIHHDRVTLPVRIPMREHLRSLNLTNSASIALYEAWRQVGYEGSSMQPDSIY